MYTMKETSRRLDTVSCRMAGVLSLTSLLTSDDTREAHSFLESDHILNLIPLLRGAG